MDGLLRSFRYAESLSSGEMDDGMNRYRMHDITLSTHAGLMDQDAVGAPYTLRCLLQFSDYKRLSGGRIPPDGPDPYVNLSCDPDGQGGYAGFSVSGRDLFTYDPNQLRLTVPSDLTLSYTGGDPSPIGSEVVLRAGTFEAPIMSVPVNSPTRVAGRTMLDGLYSLNVIPSGTVIQFFENGSYTSTYRTPPDNFVTQPQTVETGIWSARDGVLTIQAKELNDVTIDTGENRPVDFRYGVSGGVLGLELAVEACSESSDRAMCLEGRAETLQMQYPASVTALTQGVTVDLRKEQP